MQRKKVNDLTVGVDSIFEAGEVVGDAWSWLILREAIFHRVRRFNEFQSNLALARDTLTNRLAQLVDGGLLIKHRFDVRGSTEYRLTPRGKDFFPILVTSLRWGQDWCSETEPTALAATHISCGNSLKAVVSCSTCAVPLKAHDVIVEAVGRASMELIGSKRQRSPRLESLEQVERCSIARTLMCIGDRWSSLLIRECFLGTRRFDQFQTNMGIASNILSNRLQRLVTQGVLSKQVYQEKPTRLEYRLTEKGLALYPVPLSLLLWGDRWMGSGGVGSIQIRHRPCGAVVSADLTCEFCDKPFVRSEVSFVR